MSRIQSTGLSGFMEYLFASAVSPVTIHEAVRTRDIPAVISMLEKPYTCCFDVTEMDKDGKPVTAFI